MRSVGSLGLAVLAVLTAGTRAAADPQKPPPHAHSEVTVTEGRSPRAASSVSVTGGELQLRPRLRTADIVEAVPGLFAVQHAGGGKASQYFLRGFDADHGTDIAFFVDGVPVNMPSHGHGQGYTDLHFVIPELVRTLDGHKGPYHSEFGDFATAGAVDLRLADSLPENRVAFTLGRFGILRGFGAVSRDIGSDWKFLIAGEAYAQDGPFRNPEGLRRFNGVIRAKHQISPSTSMTVTGMSHSGNWNGSGQIPLREVSQGRLDRFGTLDPFEGGATNRHAASVAFEGGDASSSFRVLLYAVRYDFSLYSNFTFFLNDPIYGDMIEQRDERTTLGLDARTSFHRHYGKVRVQTTVGVQTRSDAIDNGLFHDFARQRLSTTVDAAVSHASGGVFVQEEATFTRWLRFVVGARLDHATVLVADRTGGTGPAGSASGVRGATLVSPKASAILSPARQLDLFLNFGRGFHSNDARGAVRRTSPATLLVPATGYEIGARVRPWSSVVLTAAVFRLDLDSEQVYVGDEGTTEPSAPTTRVGAELGGRVGLGRWVFADTDVTFTRATYRENAGNGNAVALAPTRTVTGGIGFRTRFGMFGSARVRHIADRPATEDGLLTAEGWTVVDAQVGQRLGVFELALDVQNLLGADFREVQFATTSRLRNEPAPVRDISFVPGWPRTIMARLTAYF